MKHFYKNLKASPVRNNISNGASHNFHSENLNPWYATGLCEGEATFTFSRTGLRSLSLYFAVKLTQKDKELIYRLHNFFGVGKIYSVKPPQPNVRAHAGWTKSAFYYRVTKSKELEKIVKHFDEYPLRGLKAKSYEIWKEMFLIKRNYRPSDYEKLEALAKKLSASSARNQP